MSLRLILVPLSMLTTMALAHWFIYFSITRLLNIVIAGQKYVLLIIIELLFFGIFLSIIFVRFSDFYLLRAYYFIEMFWVGILSKLIILFLIAWIIVYILRYFNIDFNLQIGVSILMLAFVWGLIGVYNAFNPVIKELNISTPNLNSKWEGRKIVFMSDLHLGKINNKKFAEKVVKICNDQNPDLIVITGDLFDGIGSSVIEFLPILDKLEAGQGIYLVTGNHESYLGTADILELIKKSKINILENKIALIDDLQLIGLSFPEHGKEQTGEKIIKEMENFNPDLTNILLYHIPVDINGANHSMGEQQYNSYLSPSTNFEAAKKMGINLQLSGHTHAGQMWPYTWITKKIYNGYHYGLHKDENFNIYITSGVGTWGPPVRTGSKGEIVVINLRKE